MRRQHSLLYAAIVFLADREKSLKINFRGALFAAAAVGTILSAGCRNEMEEQITVTTKDVFEPVPGAGNSYIKCLFDPVPGGSSCFTVKLEKVEKVKVTRIQRRDRKVPYTKYVWWKEFYEFFCGVGLLPVSIFSHMISAVTFNVFPFSTSAKINNLAFTGMNPALNWECDLETLREEEQLVKEGKMDADDRVTGIDNFPDPSPTILGESIVTRTLPIAETAVSLVSGNISKQYKTDEFGSFKVYYIHPVMSSENFTPRKRKFMVEPNGVAEGISVRGNTVILRRDFMQNLSHASREIASYRLQPTPKRLYNLIITLEKMGFTDLAYELEESELAKKDQKFINEFNDISD